MLRTDIDRYLKMYHEWTVPAVNDPKKVVIPYVTSYGYTRQLAEKIAEGVRSEGLVAETYDLVYGEKDKAIAALDTADGILIGTPTMVGDALPPAYEMLLHLNPIIHKGKFGGAFGSFGWSGEAVANLTARMCLLPTICGITTQNLQTLLSLARTLRAKSKRSTSSAQNLYRPVRAI